MATREDLAWAAGFFDGEGCFGASKGPIGKAGVRRYYLRSSVSQKYEPLITRLHGILGVGSVYFTPTRPTSSQAFVWKCTSSDTFEVATLLWPWLGEQKKADFKRALTRVRESRIEMANARGAPRMCAAQGCENVFAPDFRHHFTALYCSHRCCDRIYKRQIRGPRLERFCSGCGCPVDARTRGCRRCMTRHWERRRRGQGGGANGEISPEKMKQTCVGIASAAASPANSTFR